MSALGKENCATCLKLNIEKKRIYMAMALIGKRIFCNNKAPFVDEFVV